MLSSGSGCGVAAGSTVVSPGLGFHRNNVSGLTSRCSWQALDSSGVNAANSARSAPGRRGLFTWRGARDFMAEHQASAFSIVNYEQASWAGRTDQVAIPR